MKKVKAFTVSTPLTIIALVVLICVGAYLAYAVSVTNKTDNGSGVITDPKTVNTSTVNETSPAEESVPSNASEQTSQSDQVESNTSITTVDETANWQTYTNSKFGYTIKYPTEFDLVNTLYDRLAKQTTSKDEWVFIDKNKIGIDTYLDGGDWPQPYLQIISNEREIESLKTNNPNSVETEITFAGEQAIKTILTKPDDFAGKYSGAIRLNHGGNGFIISWRNTDAQNSHDSEVDQILSTFEFTK